MSSDKMHLLKNYALLMKAAKLLEKPNYAVFDDQKELIVGVLMLLLDLPEPKQNFTIYLSQELIDEIEGKLLNKICAVINKTYLMKGEKATIADDSALELIADYLLAHDEFIFYRNEKRISRKPKVPKSKKRKR